MQNAKRQYKETSLLILAAGNSSRMGSPKFMLSFDKEFTFLEKIIEGYKKFGCNEIVVVLNPKGADILEKNKSKIIDFVKVAINPHPEKERILSIQIGLRALKMIEKVYIHPVDNPFVDQSVLQLLFENSNSGDYLVPFYQGKGGHPILILNKIAKALISTSDTNQNFRSFLKNFNVSFIPVNQSLVLSNINTVADYLVYLNKRTNQK
jgi:molybdenum cofactor cytidylyltransferase